MSLSRMQCRRQLQRMLQLPADLRRTVLQELQHNRVAVPASNVSRRMVSSASSTSQSSVNQDEVTHFNALAATWWDPQGSSRLLHLMNPVRHRFIQSCLQDSTTREGQVEEGVKLKYLDVGCGGGIFAESAARLPNALSVDAVDPTPEVIAIARQHARNDPLLLEPGRLTYHNIALEELPIPSPPQAYDIVSVFEVVEHIREPAPFLRSTLKYIKPGGWLVGSTIARTATSWFTTKFVAEELIGLVPRGTHDWNQYIQPDELKAWAAKEAEIVHSKFMGVIYVPGLGWRKVSGSEQYGNYFFAFQKRAEA